VSLNQSIIEKFFNNTCTAKEAEEVVKWFATSEGQAYLADKLDDDIQLLQDEHIKGLISDSVSVQMWQEILSNMNAGKKDNAFRYPRPQTATYWYAAAIIVVIATLSIFLVWKYHLADQIFKNKQQTHFITDAYHHKAITLKDGTKIELNRNSDIRISTDYGEKKRSIKLKGEAYFQVPHNVDKPLVIHTEGADIKDLGTVFDVRAVPGEDNIQVAVKSGKVSIHPEHTSGTKAVELTAGHFGYLNLETGSVVVEEAEIQNYLSWMAGRITFDNMTLKNVCNQLGHIYNVSFQYGSDSLKSVKLSANFKRGSLKKALDIISLTISIDYRLKGGEVIWYVKDD
jgi:ferric-dicitrate binding protein FerR (iron transport regulator)